VHELDDEVLAGLITSHAVHIDDQERLAREATGVGRKEHGMPRGQMTGVHFSGKVSVEVSLVQRAAIDFRVDAVDGGREIKLVSNEIGALDGIEVRAR